MQSGINRRLFLYFLGSSFYEFLRYKDSMAVIQQTKPKTVEDFSLSKFLTKRYSLENSISPVNIGNIVQHLESDVIAGEGNYVKDFLNLIHGIRKELSGFTIQDTMYLNFGVKEPIDIALTYGDATLKSKKWFFVFSRNKNQPNIAYIDAELKPVEFLTFAPKFEAKAKGKEADYNLDEVVNLLLRNKYIWDEQYKENIKIMLNELGLKLFSIISKNFVILTEKYIFEKNLLMSDAHKRMVSERIEKIEFPMFD